MKYVRKAALNAAAPHPESDNFYYAALEIPDFHMTVVHQHPGTSRSGAGPTYNVIYILSGTLRVTTGEGAVFDAVEGDAFHFAPGEERTTANVSNQDVVFLMIGPGPGPGAKGARPPFPPGQPQTPEAR